MAFHVHAAHTGALLLTKALVIYLPLIEKTAYGNSNSYDLFFSSP